MPKQTPPSTKKLLGKNQQLKHLHELAKSHQFIENLVLETLEPLERQHTRLGTVSQTECILMVDSGLWRTRLNAKIPSIINKLKNNGYSVQFIKIKIKPASIHPVETPNPPQLSETGKRALAAVAKSLSDNSARDKK